MAGRLGVLGSEQSTATSTGGRIGRLKFEAPKVTTPTISGIPQSAWDKMKPEAQERLKTTSKQVEQSKAGSAFTLPNIASEIGKNIVNVGKTAVDIINPIPEAVSLYKQATIGAKVQPFGKGSGLMSPELVKNQTDYINSEIKKGTISKEKGQEEINKLTQSATQKQTQLSKAEKEQGVKFNQDEGVLNLLNTAANISGVTPIIKGAKKLVSSGVKLATNKPITSTVETAVENIGKRANEYIPSTTKITQQEAKIKLAKSGYKPDEIKTILSDVVPEKSLTMPGSPKKIKLDDNAVKNAVLDFEGTIPQVTKTESITAKTNLLVSHEGAPDNIRVEEYKKMIQEGKPIEPIKVINEGEKYGIEDGKHRFEAYKQLGIKDVPIEIVSPVGGNKISGNALRIQEKAVEKKLVDKMSDLPTYQSINMKDQAKQAVELIARDKQQAIDIIDGKINAPGNLKAQSVHQALEDIAMREGDAELLTKLARSNINTELSEGAQKLRIAAERDPHSPVEQIRQLRDTRLKEAKTRGIKVSKTEKADMKLIKQATPKIPKETWDSFISGLEC